MLGEHVIRSVFFFQTYHRFVWCHSFRWYHTPWYGTRSASNPPNPALARRYLPSGIYKLLVCALYHMVASAVDLSHLVTAYVNRKLKSQINRQFCDIAPFQFHIFACSSAGTNAWICVPSTAPIQSEKYQNQQLSRILVAISVSAVSSCTFAK